jgi:hypothetical protein
MCFRGRHCIGTRLDVASSAEVDSLIGRLPKPLRMPHSRLLLTATSMVRTSVV